MQESPSWLKKGPVTQQRSEDAQQWMTDNASAIAQAKANRDKASHMLKVEKAMASAASDAKTVAGKETDALTSERYRVAIETHFKWNLEFEKMDSLRKSAETLIDLWRSINSNLRGARV